MDMAPREDVASGHGKTGRTGQTPKRAWSEDADNGGNGMTLAVTLAALEAEDAETLRRRWHRLFRASPPDRISRDLLARAIAYRLQELALGGLRPAAKRKLAAWSESLAAADAAGDADVDAPTNAGPRQRAPATAMRLKPGATLVRTWHGVTHTVQVGEDGFKHQGIRYASLSHIAQVITGTHWSGPRFFGLTGVALSKLTTVAASGSSR